MHYRPVFISAVFLFLFAVIGSGMVAFTYDGTAQRIADNKRQALLNSLNELVPTDRYNNDIFHDTIQVRSSELLGSADPVTVYRARLDGWPVAAVLEVIAPDGYSGKIRLLVAINTDGTLAGVRVVEHRETPGLGDAIEAERSPWIVGFNGKSIDHPPQDSWKVKRDGGVFDQFTGATITPRAVVKAVKNALLYFGTNSQSLFAQDPHQPAEQ